MIDLDDVKAHLTATREDGEALPWDDDTIAAVLRVEHAAQLSVCTVPSAGRTDVLDKALLRRVAVNLEQTGGDPLARVGGADPEVRETERPHSKRRAPEPDEAPRTRGSHRRRATKKAPATQKENS